MELPAVERLELMLNGSSAGPLGFTLTLAEGVSRLYANDFRNHVGFYGVDETDVLSTLEDKLVSITGHKFDQRSSTLTIDYVRGPSDPDVADAVFGKMVIYGVAQSTPQARDC